MVNIGSGNGLVPGTKQIPEPILTNDYLIVAGLILGLHPANERRRDKVRNAFNIFTAEMFLKLYTEQKTGIQQV